MQEAQKHIYHCNHCGQLFESEIRSQQELCSLCGKDPLSLPFVSMASLPKSEPTNIDSKHGVAGKDEADFFSMKKQKTKKKWGIVMALWFTFLIGLAFYTYQNKSDSHVQNVLLEQDPKSDQQLIARKRAAIRAASQNFVQFGSAKTTQSKSASVLNGSDIIIDMKRYKNEKFAVNDIYRAKFVYFDLIESGKNHQIAAKMRYTPITHDTVKVKEVTDLKEVAEISADTDLEEITNALDKEEDITENSTSSDEEKIEAESDDIEKQETAITKEDNSFDFEVVFWQIDNDWKLDWQNYVRLCEIDWLSFTKSQQINSPKRFKVYARLPVTESTSFDGYAEYKLSEALNNSKTPSQLPKSVFIKTSNPGNDKMVKEFDSIDDAKINTKSGLQSALTSFDPPNSIRIDVTLDHETIEDEVVIVIKEIHDFDWLTPPNEEN